MGLAQQDGLCSNAANSGQQEAQRRYEPAVIRQCGINEGGHLTGDQGTCSTRM